MDLSMVSHEESLQMSPWWGSCRPPHKLWGTLALPTGPLPPDISPDPLLWNRGDVMQWLDWCRDEFSLPPISEQRFQMNGKALCMLTRQDLLERIPYFGDVVFNTLDALLRDEHSRKDAPGTCEPSPSPWYPSDNEHCALPPQHTPPRPVSPPNHAPPRPNPPPNRTLSRSIRVTSPQHYGTPPATPPPHPAPLQAIPPPHPAPHTVVSLLQCGHPRAVPFPQRGCPFPDCAPLHQLSPPPSAKTTTITKTTCLKTFSSHMIECLLTSHHHANNANVPSVGGRPCTDVSPTTRPQNDILLHPYQPPYPLGAPTVAITPEPAAPTSPWPATATDLSHAATTPAPRTSGDNVATCRLLVAKPDKKKRPSRVSQATALLWEFINELLSDVTYDDTVRWEDRSAFTFRIIDAHHLAELWGRQKHKSNMNYDKLARALRYYYQMNIIQRVRGQRMTYRFVKPPADIQRGVRGARPGVSHRRRRR